MNTDSPDQRVGKWEHRSMSCTAPNCADDHLHRRPYKSCEPWVAGSYVQSEAGSTWTLVHPAVNVLERSLAAVEHETRDWPAYKREAASKDPVLALPGIATAPTEPAPPPESARDCEHGHQRGKCDVCDLRAELAEVTAAHAQALVTIAELRRECERYRDALWHAREMLQAKVPGHG